jgi:O-antigen ligase
LAAFPWRWKLLFAGIALGIAAVMVLSQNPLSFFIRHFTLDPQTGYYRLLIWEFAGAEALQSPLVGIGFREWAHPAWMSPSIDSLWLGLATTYGLPAAVLFGLAILSSMHRSEPQIPDRYLDPFLVRLSHTLSLVLSLAAFVCFTVYFWGAMWTFLGALAALRTNLEEARSMQAKLLLSRRGSVRGEAQRRSVEPRQVAPTGQYRL